MELGVCGINYKHAGLDIRDKTAFTDSRKITLSEEMEKKGIGQILILGTCNRSEVYYFYETEEQAVQVESLFRGIFPGVSLQEYMHSAYGEEAVNYLFRVAAGLESQVLGEDQILGQLKDAYEFSKTMGYSGKELNRVVQDALACAKNMKTELKISEIPLSISYVGIKKLEEVCPIHGKNVLIVGSGQTAALALRYVYAYGAEKITICNRTAENAKKLKGEFPDIFIGAFENRYQIMKNCDIVISATSSPHIVIKEDRCVLNGETYFLDLAAPRDIDRALQHHMGCHLINLDMLEEVVQENHREREKLTEEGKKMIDKAVQETMNWLFAAGVDPTIQSIRMKCDEIVEDSFAYLNRKIELSKREQLLVRRTLEASFKRLFREPVAELKKLETKEEQNQIRDTLEKLFQIQ